MYRWIAAVMLIGHVAFAGTPPAPPLLSVGPERGPAEQRAIRDTALSFARALNGVGPAKPGLADYLAADFRNHDLAYPSTARAFVARHDAGEAIVAPVDLVIGEADLTLFAYRAGGGDADARVSRLVEVKNGRVTQLWYSGPTQPGLPSVAPARGGVSAAEQAANKRLVEGLIHALFIEGDDAAAARALAPDVQSHVPGVPSGRGWAVVARKHQDRVVAPDVQTELFALADGDLVAIGFPVPFAGDPGAWYALSIARVRDGRITDWWYSGLPAGHPRRGG